MFRADRLTLADVTVHTGLGALALWLTVLWNELPALAYGPVCGQDAGLLGHCPLCVPAAALTLAHIAGLIALAHRRRPAEATR